VNQISMQSLADNRIYLKFYVLISILVLDSHVT
jgi:hypothetical protein